MDTMTSTPTEPYVSFAQRDRARDEERSAARRASLAAVDFTKGRHNNGLQARDVKPGMVITRLCYDRHERPAFPTDVVVSAEPSTVIVGGMQITYSDGTSAGYGGDDTFDSVWVPFKKA